MRSALFFSILLILSIVSCKKPSYSTDGFTFDHSVPVLFYTSLADTLPKKTFEELKLHDRVVGIKINNLNGLDVRYFEYQIDADVLISALSKMSFDKREIVADTICRKITSQEMELALMQVSAAELACANSFFNSTLAGFDMYECLKSPYRHHVIVDRLTNMVKHRIERMV